MKIRLLLATAVLSSVTGAATTRETFDQGWRFARFGDMPDGSRLAEPGSPGEGTSASSSEDGNPPGHAVDGNPQTRWCASSGAAGEWLKLDLGRPVRLGRIEIDWEKPAVYPHKVEVSADGTAWQTAVDKTDSTHAAGWERHDVAKEAQFVRITVGRIAAAGQWASIKELRAIDAQGAPVRPGLPGEAVAKNPSAPDFDDSKWRTLDLPHDWGIEGPFRMDLPNETGKLPWHGIGWYRKTLELPSGDDGRRLYLDFDGAMSRAKVFVDGKPAGEWAYGYNSFRVELTPHVKPGGRHVIAVRLDNPPHSSRWYPGGGIYRHVWLVNSPPTHIAQHGVFARSENVSATSAEVVVETFIEGPDAAGTTLVHELVDACGKRQAFTRVDSSKEGARISVRNPALWSVENPNLYTLRTSLVRGTQRIDVVENRIGIRSAEWKPDGFYLNGKRVQIKGVCNHHDLGALGAAFNTRAAERQIELLKEMGCNSIRTSHNPPAPQLLDLCDRMGILVLDELFDAWKMAKKPNDYHIFFDAWHERDVAAFIRRDRNHPCVIAWSTGNEIPEQGDTKMHWISQKLADEIRKYDHTRAITAGCNNLKTAYNGFAETVDIFGMNYPVRQNKLPGELRSKKPGLPMLSTETSSCVSSRGSYYFPVKWDKGSGFYEFQVSSYELYAPGWANRPDLDFELLERNPFIAGEYVWTGFDYIGEPTPYNQDTTNALNFQNPEERAKAMEELRKLGGRAPSRSSYFGILDLCGFPKDRYYLYQAHWRPDHPMAHILPHWNWPERAGQPTPVHVFTSGDEAELFLNGKSLGRRKKEKFQYRLVWEDVIYQPGTLTVKAWKHGKPWAEADRSTTGPASKLLATADRPEIRADGDDLCYVTITVADDKDRLVPRSMHRLHFDIDGAAEIVAVCNGDATNHESLQGRTMPAFNGMCQVILRGKRGTPGTATLKVRAEGGPGPATVEIRTR